VNADVAEPFTTRVTLSAALIAELGDARSRLKATAQRSDSAVIVNAGGEVDAFNEHIWRRLIGEAAAAAEPPGVLVIDVNDFDFLGCCALHVLTDEAQRCRERGIGVRLVSRRPTTARHIAACGFTGILPVHPTAVAALSTRQ
jgi:anti-anti-sigma factor